MINKILVCALISLCMSHAVFAEKPHPKKTIAHRKPSDNGTTLPDRFERGKYFLVGKITKDEKHQTFIRLFPGTETEVAILLSEGIPVGDSYLLDGNFYKIEVQFNRPAPPANAQASFISALEMVSSEEGMSDVWKKLN